MRKTGQDEETEADGMRSIAVAVPVVLPAHVRRWVHALPIGAEVEMLRDSVLLATLKHDGQNTLGNIRRVLLQSVGRDGDGAFTVSCDAGEVGWLSGEHHGGATPGDHAADSLLSYASRMESIAFRALDRAMAAAVKLHEMSDHREAIAAKNSKMLSKAMRALSKAIRENSNEDPAIAKIAIEAEQEDKRLELLSGLLPMLGLADPAKPGASDLAQRVLAALTDDERAVVLGTDAGRGLQAAGNLNDAQRHLRTLWDDVKAKRITLSRETVDKVMSVVNG